MPSTEPLFRLAYLSENRLPPAAAEAGIRQILASARRNNPPRGLTGALLFTTDSFAQVLEGPEAAVWETYRRIEADPRHAEAMVVASGPIAARSFGHWSMAYIGASPAVAEGFAAVIAGHAGAEAGPAVVDLLLGILAGMEEEEEGLPA